MSDLLIRNVRPWGGEAADLVVRGGVLVATAPAGASAPEGAGGAPSIDGAGMLALPAFSDVHVHLDSTRIGLPFRPHSVSERGLWGMIQNDRENWRDAEATVSERATRTLGSAIAHGLTRARSYAQVDADCGLERLDGVLAAREHHRERARVEVVAFPQAGLLLEPGVPALMEQALRDGADLVGGIDPCGLDGDPKRHLDIVFGLAEGHGAGIDIHLHEPGELGLFTARKIIERTRALDYRGRVTIAHAFFLGEIGEGVRSALLDELAELDIALTTVAPGGRGELPMLEILDHGIRLGLGQDGQRDYWSPYGNTDMLDRAWQLAFTNNLRRDADIESVLETATVGGARVMDAAAFSRASRGFAVGDPADYVLVPGETPTSAVMDRPGGRIVVHDGCVVAVDGALR